MLNPPHLGELIRESIGAVVWNVTPTPALLGCEHWTLSRLPHGRAGVSVNTVPALEVAGWDTAGHWMRMRASYGLAQAAHSEPPGNCGRM